MGFIEGETRSLDYSSHYVFLFGCCVWDEYGNFAWFIHPKHSCQVTLDDIGGANAEIDRSLKSRSKLMDSDANVQESAAAERSSWLPKASYLLSRCRLLVLPWTLSPLFLGQGVTTSQELEDWIIVKRGARSLHQRGHAGARLQH